MLQGECVLGPILLLSEAQTSLQRNYLFPLLINPIEAGVKRRVMPLKGYPVLSHTLAISATAITKS